MQTAETNIDEVTATANANASEIETLKSVDTQLTGRLNGLDTKTDSIITKNTQQDTAIQSAANAAQDAGRKADNNKTEIDALKEVDTQFSSDIQKLQQTTAATNTALSETQKKVSGFDSRITGANSTATTAYQRTMVSGFAGINHTQLTASDGVSVTGISAEPTFRLTMESGPVFSSGPLLLAKFVLDVVASSFSGISRVNIDISTFLSALAKKVKSTYTVGAGGLIIEGVGTQTEHTSLRNAITDINTTSLGDTIIYIDEDVVGNASQLSFTGFAYIMLNPFSYN